jgi:PAS domain S-box-containing protein
MVSRLVSQPENASKTDPVRILIVEDSLADYELAQREIRTSLESCLFERVESEREFLNAIESFQPDIVLSDYKLPKFDGLKALKLLQERAPITPLILWTGSLSEETAVESMKAGANNYVIKENIKRLAPAVLHAIEERRLQLDRKKAEEDLVASETRFRSLIENSTDEVSIIAPDGSLLYESPSANPTLGYRPREFLGRKLFQLVHPDDLPDVQKQFETLVRNPTFSPRLRFRLLHQNGSWRWVEAVGTNLVDEPAVGGVVVNYHDVTEQVRAENQLKYHARLLRHINDAVIATDDQFRITAWNQAAESMYGWKSEEVLGRNVSEILSYDFTVEQRAKAREQLGSSLTARSERVHRRRNGQTLYVETNTIALTDEHHRLTGYVSVNRDVTKRREAEERLRYQAYLLSNVKDAIIATDENYRITYWNQAAELLYGWRAEEVTGKPGPEITQTEFPGSDEDEMRRYVREKGYWRGEVTQIKKDGTRFPCEIASLILHDDAGKIAGYVSVNHDITERRQAEEALRESEERFSKTFYQSPVGIVLTDLTDNTIRDVNDAILEMLGRTRQELVGQNVLQLDIQVDPEVRAAINRDLREHGSFHNKEVRLHMPNGEIRDILDSGVLLTVGGKPHHLGLLLDITERKQAEEKLHLSDQILQRVNAVVLVADKQGKIAFVSPGVRTILGYEPDDLLGDGWWSVSRLEPAEAQREKEYVARAARGDIPIETEAYERPVIDRSGNEHWILWVDAAGPGDTLIGVGHDITERKEMEEALRTSQERYRALFEDTPIAIWEEDFSQVKRHLDGLKEQGVTDFHAYFTSNPDAVFECTAMIRILDVNRAALQMYHARSKDELLGSTGQVLSKAERDHLHEDLTAIAAGRTRSGWEGTDETLTGETIEISLSWSVAPGHEDDYSKVIVSTIDITERKRAEQQVRIQLQRLNALRDIDRTITSTFDLRLSLNFLITRAIAILEVDAAAILLVNTNFNSLEYIASMGFWNEPNNSVKIRLGEGFAGKAALERETIHIENMADHPNFVQADFYVVDEGMVGYYGVPLVAKGRILGVLEVFQRSVIARDTDWLDFLQSLAEQAAIAIDNAQAFEGMQRSNIELIMAYDATIAGWSRAMDLRDKETEGHTQRVTELTVKLAQRMGLGAEDQIQIQRGALLHDIGKLGVPDSILLKPDKLTPEEWEHMKQHPVYARDMLSSIAYLRPAVDIPYCHHEKWDGTGYPQGLAGERIPLAARIFAVVDVWDALTSDRPYRPAWTKEEALHYIREQSGKHFDPQVVNTFLMMIS